MPPIAIPFEEVKLLAGVSSLQKVIAKLRQCYRSDDKDVVNATFFSNVTHPCSARDNPLLSE